MPELPEVETIKNGLVPFLTEARLTKLCFFRPNLRYPLDPSWCQILEGETVLALERRAKWLIFHFSGNKSIINHLGMSGIWRLHQGLERVLPQKHDHIQLQFAPSIRQKNFLPSSCHQGFQFFYHDPRRFGSFLLKQSDEVNAYFEAKNLGVEPLSDALTIGYLEEKFYNKTQNLKAILLDQSIIAGLGNIYVCEALWQAKLSPYLPAKCLAKQGSVHRQQLEQLIKAIKSILRKAIAAGGSSLRDYKHIRGESGHFQHSFSVYNRYGQPCPRCQNLITFVKQNNRSTYYCMHCQSLEKEA